VDSPGAEVNAPAIIEGVLSVAHFEQASVDVQRMLTYVTREGSGCNKTSLDSPCVEVNAPAVIEGVLSVTHFEQASVDVQRAASHHERWVYAWQRSF
jgi:hypothetical protein